MIGYRLGEDARHDMFSLMAYLAADNPYAALRWRAKLYAAFKKLGATPGMGHRREELTDQDLLCYSLQRRFTIVYRTGSPIEIVRIVRAGRDIGALLG